VKAVERLELESEARTWADRANCRGVDPDLFFPDRGEPTRHAKEVCRGCEVRDECLGYALASGQKFGIWGGTSERERRLLRRRLPPAVGEGP
jgi:WhiB family redox-sensing transcriptional regulator